MKKFLLVAFFVALTYLLKAQQVTPTTTTIIRGLSSSVGYLTDTWEGYTLNQSIDDWYINPNGTGYQTFYSYCGIDCRGVNPVAFNGTNFSNTGTFLIKDHTNEYGYSNEVTVTVIDSYVTSPGAVSSGQSICSGSTPALLTLSGASGENIHYKWLQKIGIGSWTIIPGATGLTYQPPSLTQNTTYKVNVYIYDDSFYQSAVSANIIIYSTSVNAGSFISSTICYNTSTTLTQATSPSGGSGDYTFQWEDSPDGITYIAITGATSASYTTPALTASKNFRRLVTDATCGYSSYCNPFSVTVNPDVNPGSITADQTICNSTAPALLSTGTSPTGGNGIFTLQWLGSLDNSTYNPVSGATGTTYQPGSLTQTTYYIKQVVNSCKTVLTSPVTVTVKGTLDGGTIRNTQTICYNTTPSQIATSVFPAGGMGVYTNSWEYSLDGSLWFNITGETLSAYQPGALTQTTFYRKKVTDSSCGYTYSNTVIVNIRANFSPGSISSNQTICYNTAPINLTNNVNPSGGSGDYAYQWEYSTDNSNFFVISGATWATYQPGALTVTTYYKKKVTDASCDNGYTPTVMITVKPNFSVGTIGNSQTICYNSTPILLNTDVAPSGGMGVYTYQWESSSNGMDWSAISGATGVSYQPGTLTSSTYYHRKVTDNSCGSGFSTSILITVRSPFASGAIGLDQQICYSSAPNLLITTTAPTGESNSFTYTWESSFDNTNWNVISGAAGTSYQPGILTTKTYYRKSVTDICGNGGYTNTVTVTVRPIFKAGNIGYPEIICYGFSPAIIVSKVAPSGGSGSYTYEWSSGNNGINWNLIPSATGETYQPGILTQTTYFRRKVIDVCGSGYSLNDTVTVRPALVPGSISSNQSICYNTAPSRFTSLSLPSGATGVYTYQWQSSTNNVSWSNISGATSDEYQPLPMVSSLYFRRVETSGSCGTVQTNSIFITLNSQLVAGSIKSDETICYGHSPGTMITNTAPVGGTGAYSYQWQKLVGTVWTDISGATTETFTSNALISTSYFRRTETSGSCGTVISNQITKTVLQQFSGGIIGSSQTISYNTAPILLTSLQSPSGATLPYTFQWMKSEDNSYFVNVNGATF